MEPDNQTPMPISPVPQGAHQFVDEKAKRYLESINTKLQEKGIPPKRAYLTIFVTLALIIIVVILSPKQENNDTIPLTQPTTSPFSTSAPQTSPKPNDPILTEPISQWKQYPERSQSYSVLYPKQMKFQRHTDKQFEINYSPDPVGVGDYHDIPIDLRFFVKPRSTDDFKAVLSKERYRLEQDELILSISETKPIRYGESEGYEIMVDIGITTVRYLLFELPDNEYLFIEDNSKTELYNYTETLEKILNTLRIQG